MDNWPLIVFEFSGEPNIEEHKQALNVWNELFTQRRKFIAVRIFHDDIAIRHTSDIGKLSLEWLDSGARDSIKEWVTAMLNITPESSFNRMKGMSVEKVFGVPGGIFKSTQDASQWLRLNIDGDLDYSLLDAFHH